MKFIKSIAVLAVAATFASCSITTPLTATSNTVGMKRGEATASIFLSCISFGGDASIDTAAKKAGIKKISHVDVKNTSILGIYGTKTVIVYGE